MRAVLLLVAAIAIAGAAAQSTCSRHPLVLFTGYQNGRELITADATVSGVPTGCAISGTVELGASGWPDHTMSAQCQWFYRQRFTAANGARSNRPGVTIKEKRTGTFADLKVDLDRRLMEARMVNVENYTMGVDAYMFAINQRDTAHELGLYTTTFGEADDMIMQAQAENCGLKPVVGCWSLGCNVLEEYLANRDQAFQDANIHWTLWASADLGGEKDVPGALASEGYVFYDDPVTDGKALNNNHGLAVAMPALELYGDQPALQIGNAHPKTWSQIPNLIRQNGFGEFASTWLNNAPKWRVPKGNVAVVFPVNGTCPKFWYLANRDITSSIVNVDMESSCDTEQPTVTNAALGRWFTQVLYPYKMIMESMPEVQLQEGQSDYHTAQLASDPFWRVVRRISAL